MFIQNFLPYNGPMRCLTSYVLIRSTQRTKIIYEINKNCV